METKRILVRENFDKELVQEYTDKGYEVHILSDRIKLSNDDRMKFGNIRDLHNRYNYEVLLTGDDPVLEKFMATGRKYNGKVIDSKSIYSVQEAIDFKNQVKTMKFLTVTVVYRYELRGDAPALKGPTSRPFCVQLTALSDSGIRWTQEEISSMNNGMPSDVSDVFEYRGGYYNVPDSSRIDKGCRHKFVAETIIEY
jgi:hypothetical protein